MNSLVTYYAPDSKFGQLLADTMAADALDPLETLCQLEDYLLKTYGMTFMQAVRAGVLNKATIN